MKKLLGIVLALASIGVVASTAEAASGAAPAAQVRTNLGQWQRRPGRWNNRRARVITQTRIVRRGRQLFRETFQVTYLPNGRTVTRLISRVRVR